MLAFNQENSLTETQNLVAKVYFQASEEALFITSKEGHFLDVSKTLASWLGYSRRELIGRSVEETYAFPMARQRFQRNMEAKGKLENYPIRMKSKVGTQFQVFCSAHVWGDGTGKSGYYGKFKKSSEVETTVESKHYHPFHRALEAANDGLWHWNLLEKTIRYNSRWKEILGYRENELEDRLEEWFSRIVAADSDLFRKNLNAYLNGEVPVLQIVFRMKHKDGGMRSVLLRGKGEWNAAGQVLSLSGSLTNLTQQLNVIEKLKTNQKQLSDENEKLSSDNHLLSQYFSNEQVKTLRKLESTGEDLWQGDCVVISLGIAEAEKWLQQLGTKKLVDVANEIFTDLMDLIYGLGGSVLRLDGVGLLASFGASIDEDNKSPSEMIESGIHAAIQCLTYVSSYNEVRPEELKQEVALGVGISMGKVFMASIGSVRRKELTLLGETVSISKLAMRKALEQMGGLCLDDRCFMSSSKDLSNHKAKKMSADHGSPHSFWYYEVG